MGGGESCPRASEMLGRGLKTLDERDEVEDAEKAAKEREKAEEAAAQQQADASPVNGDPPLDPALVEALAYDPSDPFWASATLDFGGGTPQVSQGT